MPLLLYRPLVQVIESHRTAKHKKWMGKVKNGDAKMISKSSIYIKSKPHPA